ncbi:MAG: hypothetical protein K2X87_33810 [Gemmataceae bacterium]|nr:hypothetical protein [Gemmataceae bacterium]
MIQRWSTTRPNRSSDSCSCAAGTYRRVRECCHVAALRALLLNGRLDDPRADPRPAPKLPDDVPF